MSVFRITLFTCLLACAGAAQAQSAQFTLNAWAHGLSGDYDEVNLTGSGAGLADGAVTGGNDNFLDASFRKGTRGHTTFSAGTVSALALGMRSFSQTSATADPGFGGYGTGSLTTQGRVSAIVPFRVDNAILNGQAGVMHVPLHISGQLSLGTGISSNFPGSTSGEAEVLFDVSGRLLNPVGGCPSGFDLCERVVDIGLGPSASGSPIAGTTMVEFSFIYGQWTTFSMQLQTRATANAFALAGNQAIERADVGFVAEAAFGHTVRWGGIDAVLDAQGNSVETWTITSVQGVDLAAPVPEPGQAIMWMSGLFALAGLVRRRNLQPV